ncbi:uncharacterized protein MYCFIDRAFT_209845 [Pseudocercospora fijiensis CIRAD86]|uniref:Uncharacterized protein n=1 Tax=Pseudocercospora fijiensis (strain CIRAD86) TaxID=383855 RepID=N1Q9T1_PSEFD|nr:uncharacterized protein MYCFIDRAFT_209845 [Pseudocercospora fijiensis CIRAD86]EME88566.1 hypothetical protein MYCFIDRAFT_209845 [Pseudocercospora fijiensis CIRAD86]
MIIDMDGGISNTGAPDLAAILATLAKYKGDGSSTEPNTPESRQTTPATSFTDGNNHRTSLDQKAQDPRLRPQSRSSAAAAAAATPTRPMIDPATITVWSEGLRCVTKLAAQNAQFAESIRRMIKDQRANEMRWYSERQSLKQTQANRSSSAARAQSILKSLNTSFYGSPPEVVEPEVDKERELAEFDQKLYSAQVTMESAMILELKGLGVPFFGTDASLVVSNDSDLSKDANSQNNPKWSPLVTEDQLMVLRRKMVQHLEDLYKD